MSSKYPYLRSRIADATAQVRLEQEAPQQPFKEYFEKVTLGLISRAGANKAIEDHWRGIFNQEAFQCPDCEVVFTPQDVKGELNEPHNNHNN